jgi:hypothetical protein
MKEIRGFSPGGREQSRPFDVLEGTFSPRMAYHQTMTSSCQVLAGLIFVTAQSVGIAQQRALASEPPPTAHAIMARVAANQDRAEEERTHYIYMQHTRVISRRGKTIMCEEITDSRVTPSANGSHIELLKLDGRLLQKHQYITYTTLPNKESNNEADRKNDRDELHDEDVDRDLVESMRKNLVSDKSRDGIGSKLFPLTSKNQREYMFHLVGREHKNGREVFHIIFEPKNKNEYTWKGDAFVDTTAYQPVVGLEDRSMSAPRDCFHSGLKGDGPVGRTCREITPNLYSRVCFLRRQSRFCGDARRACG